jgi:hypothetical protein
MITRIEALNYRCRRYVRQDLGPFHVLVGPNASGKTTFLDVVAFLGRLVFDGPEAAVVERTENFQDLIWGRQGDRFELAIEAAIPHHLKRLFAAKPFNRIRYEVAIGHVPGIDDLGILNEKALLKRTVPAAVRQRTMFPDPDESPDTILTERLSNKLAKTIINKVAGGNDNYYSEVYRESGKG